MNNESRVLILGGRGMVGSSIKRALEKRNISPLTPSRKDLNLLQQVEVDEYFKENRPTVVVNAAAKVGGILANNTYRADFIFENLTMQNNIFKACFETPSVDQFLFLGSSCIYPKMCPQPMKEEYLLSGALEETNEPYAIAKIAGLKTAESFRRQYGKNYFSVMPTNLYGENDNYHPENSHVIPGLINRMAETIKNGLNEFEVWGTGTPKREFLHVNDLAEACVFLLETEQELPYWINIGTGIEISIGELASLIAEEMGFKGKIVFNKEFPDGTPRKLLDVSKINKLGWKAKISLKEGIRSTISDYKNSKHVRKV